MISSTEIFIISILVYDWGSSIRESGTASESQLTVKKILVRI
jgi:hypothetical protein